MTNEFKIAAVNEFAAQDVYYLLDAALYGGSNHWYWLPDMREQETLDWYNSLSEDDRAKNVFGDSACELAFFRMLCDHTFRWEVTDAETEELLGHVSYDLIVEGLNLMASDYDWHFNNFKNECWDAETADVFLQLVVMHDIVFG